jgi:hypothetical protein
LILIFWCFNATFNNISAISWRPILVVEEAEVPERTTDHVNFITFGCESSAPFFVIYNAGREPTPYCVESGVKTPKNQNQIKLNRIMLYQVLLG